MTPKTTALHRMGDTGDGDDPRWDRLLRMQGPGGVRALEIAAAERVDDGYFGPDSISWKIYNNMIVAGMGAMQGLFVVMLEPLGAYGVGQHTDYHADTLGRIRRSLQFFTGAVFGDSETADRVGRNLFRRHAHVTGEVPVSGESYHANSLHLLTWVYVLGWQCLWNAYTTFGDPDATDADERQFYAEQHIVAELLGLPVGEVSLTPEGIRDYIRDGEALMAFTRPAQELLDFLLRAPMTPLWPMLPLSIGARVLMWAAIPLLPPFVREITDLNTMVIRPKIGTAIVKLAARAVKTPMVDRLAAALVGYDTWGYYHNAVRRTAGAGPVPFTHDPGLALQHGKGGTLTAPEHTGDTEQQRAQRAGV